MSAGGINSSKSFLEPAIQLGGEHFISRVDTGADISLINVTVAEKVGKWQNSNNSGPIFGADGRPLEELGHIRSRVNFLGFETWHDFKIIENLAVPVLVGIDLLGKCEARIDMGKREIGVARVPFGGEVNFAEIDRLGGELGEEFRDLLLKYKNIFGTKPGLTTVIEHRIETGTNTPVSRRPYSLSPEKYEIVREQIKEMLDDGIIEPAESPWAAPVVLVKKKDSSKFRFCVDYRQLNSVTVDDKFPLPLIPSVIQNLGDAHIWSTLDLASGYWQVRVVPEHREKTAFIVPFGSYQFKVLSFGLKNAPSTFQRLMNRVLGHLIGICCEVYLDDIIIYSKTKTEHTKHLGEVFGALEEAGLTLNVDKCHFFQTSLDFLGFHIGQEGVQPQKDKITAIADYQPPKTIKQLRRFLGLCSWHKDFIKDFAVIARPLYDLTKKQVLWNWGSEAKIAFERLKQALVNTAILSLPQPDAEIFLYTDASDYGLGCTVSQRFPSGKETVIAYGSRVLRAAELNYTTTEKECLAIVWACERFRIYFSQPFTIVTDHAALQWLQSKKSLKGRLSRWILQLQDFSFTIIHRPGPSLVVPDALSRNPGINDEVIPDLSCKVFLTRVCDPIDLIFEQERDKWYSDIFIYLRDGILPGDDVGASGTVSRAKKYKLDGGILYYEVRDRVFRVAIPRKMIPIVCREFHDLPSAGHLGVRKTRQRCIERVYWPTLRADVATFVKSCEICQLHKHEQCRKRGLMQSTTVSAPGEMWGIDLIGPLPRSSKGNIFCLVIVDYYSKWVEFFPIRRATSEVITRILVQNVICRFGFPKFMLSDNGPQFIAEIYRLTMQAFGVKCRYTTPYHPQTNLTERINRTLGTMMASFVGRRHGTWDRHLAELALAVRTVKSETTGETPAKLFLGREIAIAWDARMGECFWEVAEHFDKTLAQVTERVTKAQERQKRNYNNKRQDVIFEVGNTVLVREHPISSADRHEIAKFLPKWRGPYTIHRKLSDLVYEVIDDAGDPRGVYNICDLKLFVRRQGDLLETSDVSASEDEDISPLFEVQDQRSQGFDPEVAGPSGLRNILSDDESEEEIIETRPRRKDRVNYRKLAGLK